MADLGIGTARKQKVFAVKETTSGTLKFPASDGSDFIMPAGPATIKQTPDFINSEEINDSLDVIDQFQNAQPPGDWSCNMYLRLPDDHAEDVQGDILLECLQGSKVNSGTVAGSLAVDIAADATEIAYTTLTGDTRFPETGVIEITDADNGNEKIYYRGITASSLTGTFHNCIRGWDGSTAGSHAGDASGPYVIKLHSDWYRQAVNSPTFSLWVMTDHFTQGLSGCTVNSGSVGVDNEGAVTFTMSGQGMAMVWAGSDDVATETLTTQLTVYVTDASKFSVGAFVYCLHADGTSDDNSDAGYQIASIDSSANTLTFVSGQTTGSTWAVTDEVIGYLPTGTTVPNAIESRYTYVWVDDGATESRGKFRSSDLSFNVPKNYIIDEVGTTNPEGFVEDVREITTDMNIYFRKDDAKYFELGSLGNTFKMHLLFGNMGTNVPPDGAGFDDVRKLGISMPKARSNTPTIGIEGATVTLAMPTTALGVKGEDSCDIVII